MSDRDQILSDLLIRLLANWVYVIVTAQNPRYIQDINFVLSVGRMSVMFSN